MKFNAYILELKSRENSFTVPLLLNTNPPTSVSANFKKIGNNLFIANFKTQMEFKFMENLTLKGTNKEAHVLLPVTSKYNQRKLTKISKFLSIPEEREKETLISHLLTVEKFIKLEELEEFMSIDREEIIPFLLEQEIRKTIKIISFSNLFITSFENLQNHLDELNAILTNCYTSRTKSIKLSEIEEKLKLPQGSIFFKYLVRKLSHHFSFKVTGDKIVFQKLALSETEKGSVDQIEAVIRENKLNIFSIESIASCSEMLVNEVNNSLWFLVENGKVVQLNEKYYMFTEDLNKTLNKLKKYKRNQGEMIDIQAFREMTQLSRKYIIILFEYFDAQQITLRVENKRQILLSA